MTKQRMTDHMYVQVDFVGHAQNPHYKRGLPKGEAARLAAPLQHLRVEPRANDPQSYAFSWHLHHEALGLQSKEPLLTLL